MSESLQIVVAHGDGQTLEGVIRGLGPKRRLVASCSTIPELRDAVEQHRPDLLVCGVVFPDGDGLEACIEIGRQRPLPVVIVTSHRSMELVTRAMEDHVMAYLIEPIRSDDLQAAIIVAWSRYQQLRELEEEVGDLREALEQRKLIERAKGVLMAAEGLTEGEAYARIRAASQDARTPMVRIAEGLLRNAERGSERCQN